MRLYFLLGLSAFYFSPVSWGATVDCPAQYPSGNALSFADGTVRYPTGETLRFPDGTLRFPNGKPFRFADGTFRYESGKTLRFPDGTFRYPNESTARLSDGALRNSEGAAVTGSVEMADSFGPSFLKVTVRAKAAEFQTSVAYGPRGLLLLTISEDGSVVCSVEGGGQETQLRIDGALGNALVTIEPGQNIAKIRQAIEKALNAR